METLHLDSPPTHPTTSSRLRSVVFWFAVVANLALFGLAAQQELAILLHHVELPPNPHPVLREHARQPPDHGYVFPLAICLGNLVALARMRRRDDPRPLVHLWTLGLLILAPVALAGGLTIVSVVSGVISGMPRFEGVSSSYAMWFTLVIVGYFATLLALHAWKTWRPSWWQLALFFPPMLIIELAFVFPSVMQFVETAIYGPPPADDGPFGESMNYYMEIGDPSEWLFPSLIVLWFVLFLCGALRRLVQIAVERELTLGR